VSFEFFIQIYIFMSNWAHVMLKISLIQNCI